MSSLLAPQQPEFSWAQSERFSIITSPSAHRQRHILINRFITQHTAYLYAALLIVCCGLYFWRAFDTIDYPLWDESDYFARGVALTQGKIDESQVLDPRTSPAHIIYYAGWYEILHTSNLYPAVIVSSLIFLSFSAYLLYLRFFSAPISWLLAVLTLIAAAPIISVLANYYLGTAILWLGLSLPNRNLWRRSLGLLIVLLSTYVRPEFNLCFLFLLGCLIVYEVRLLRRQQITVPKVLTAYAMVLVASATTLLLWNLPRSTPGGIDYDRTLAAIPWSYTNFLERVHPEQFGGNLSYGHIYETFEKDFAPIDRPITVTGMLLAMTRNPKLTLEFLGNNGTRLFVAYGSSLVNSTTWKIGHGLPYRVSLVSVMATAGALLALIALLLGLRWILHRRHLPTSLGLGDKPLARLSLFSLVLLIPGLILINPQQRYFMLFPIVLFFVGLSLTWLRRLVAFPAWLAALLVIGVLVLTPHPYNLPANKPDSVALDLLRHNLPPTGATLLAYPAKTYSNYLSPEGYRVEVLDPEFIDPPAVVNAEKQNPSLNFLLRTSALPEAFWEKNFDAWNAAFPNSPWKLVVKNTDYGFALYQLDQPAAG